MKWAVAVVLAVGGTVGAVAPTAPPTVEAAPPGPDEVIAFEVRGVGNGHGRGLSQWGAFGRAVDGGQTWQQILGAYYGGTSAGFRSEPHLKIRLTPWDGAVTIGVVSRPGTARWQAPGEGRSGNHSSLYTVETAPNVFSVYGVKSTRACPGAPTLIIPFVDLQQGSTGADVVRLQQFLTAFGYDPKGVDGTFGVLTAAAVRAFQVDEGLPADGRWRRQEANAAQARVDAASDPVAWKELATGVTGPITFSTSANQSTVASGEVLGVCRVSGALNHYRGRISVVSTSEGNRLVNDVDVENYLRGVLPKEMPSSWGDAGGGAGMHALRAQSVAARSYGLRQSRYSYASTCDTSSCQVYGGSATRATATATVLVRVEQDNSDAAIADTAGVVREWPDGSIVSTEFSASNGPRTAGGAFPPVDDPWDDAAGNPNHRWTRVIDADSIRSRYGLSSASSVRTVADSTSSFDGIWANEVRLGDGRTISAWDFRNAFGLLAPGFELLPITRDAADVGAMSFIGDSVGDGVTRSASAPVRTLFEGVFTSTRYDTLVGRRTALGGVAAAGRVPIGTDHVVVELGYNDDPAAMPGAIDEVMAVLRERQVGLVVWVNVSERRSEYASTNRALEDATDRWSELIVLDWNAASSGRAQDRWFSDDVHLTSTGAAEFSLWLRRQVMPIVLEGYTPPRQLRAGSTLRIPLDAGDEAVGVALNVTAVETSGPGFLRVWGCGSGEPETSSVNFVGAGAVEPNAVVVPVDASGEVCVSSLVDTDVIVDVTAWFDEGLSSARGARIVDTRYGIGPIPPR